MGRDRIFIACVTVAILGSTPARARADGFLPNDPDFSLQWGLYNVGQTIGGVAGTSGADIAATLAWGLHMGTSSVTVAIIGRGVDAHPQFADRLVQGTATVGDPFDTHDTCPNDTHLAGIIAAATNDAVGTAGINGRARIMPVRAFNGCGGTQAAVAAGIRWAVDHGAHVVLVPVQFAPETGMAICQAVEYAVSSGVLVIASAGHSAIDEIAYPARCAGAVAVTATDHFDNSISHSNVGPELDLAAPGANIWSTWLAGGYAYLPDSRETHAAAAFVAGVVSLVMSYAPQLSAEDVLEVLVNSSDDLGEPGWDDRFGFGRVNAASALQLATPPPLRFERLQAPPTMLPPGVDSSFFVRIANGTQTVLPVSPGLWHRTNFGAFSLTALQHVREDVYRVALPAQACATVSQFYFVATGHAGTLVTDPPSAPFAVFNAQVAFDTVLFADDFETDTGWQVDGGDNNSGRWSRVIPVPTSAQPGFDATRGKGRYCFVTGQHIGGSEGSNDVDGQTVVLTSPVISLSAPSAVIQFAYWLFTSHPDGPDRLTVELSRDGGSTWAIARQLVQNRSWNDVSIQLGDFPKLTGDHLRIRFSTVDADDPSLLEAAVDEVRVTALTCAAMIGDPDGDGLVGVADSPFLPICLRGPARDRSNGPCSRLDFNNDFLVDLRDFAGFQRAFDSP